MALVVLRREVGVGLDDPDAALGVDVQRRRRDEVRLGGDEIDRQAVVEGLGGLLEGRGGQDAEERDHAHLGDSDPRESCLSLFSDGGARVEKSDGQVSPILTPEEGRRGENKEAAGGNGSRRRPDPD